MLWRVAGKSGGRTAHSGQFAVTSTQRRRRCGRCIVGVLVHGAAPSVHEEVDDRRHFESKLFRDRRLNLLARTLDLAEDGHQGAPLDLSKHHPRLLAGNGRARVGARRCSTGHIMSSLSTCSQTDPIKGSKWDGMEWYRIPALPWPP